MSLVVPATAVGVILYSAGRIDDWSQLAGRTQKECYAVGTIAKKFCARFKQIDSRTVKSRKSWNVKVISLLYQGTGIPK